MDACADLLTASCSGVDMLCHATSMLKSYIVFEAMQERLEVIAPISVWQQDYAETMQVSDSLLKMTMHLARWCKLIGSLYNMKLKSTSNRAASACRCSMCMAEGSEWRVLIPFR